MIMCKIYTTCIYMYCVSCTCIEGCFEHIQLYVFKFRSPHAKCCGVNLEICVQKLCKKLAVCLSELKKTN